MRKQWTNIRGFVLFAGIFLFILATDVVLVWQYYRYIERFIEAQPQTNQADAGIIFFGDYTKDGVAFGIALGPDSKNRAQSAINLYKKGTIRNIICVGGYDIRNWKGKPHLMSSFLIENGIPPDVIIHDSLSFNTITNWREAKKIIERERFHKVIAISAPLHIYRISRMIDSSDVAYASYKYNPQSFSDYLQIVKDVHHEWVSFFLSFALKDDVRGRVVYIGRTILSAIRDVF